MEDTTKRERLYTATGTALVSTYDGDEIELPIEEVGPENTKEDLIREIKLKMFNGSLVEDCLIDGFQHILLATIEIKIESHIYYDNENYYNYKYKTMEIINPRFKDEILNHRENEYLNKIKGIYPNCLKDGPLEDVYWELSENVKFDVYTSADDDKVLYSNDGPFYKVYSYQKPNGSFIAFGGHVFHLKLDDGRIMRCEGQYWATNPDVLGRVIGVEMDEIAVAFVEEGCTEGSPLSVMVTKSFKDKLIKKFSK